MFCLLSFRGWSSTANDREPLHCHLIFRVFLRIILPRTPPGRCVCDSVEVHECCTFSLQDPIQEAVRSSWTEVRTSGRAPLHAQVGPNGSQESRRRSTDR